VRKQNRGDRLITFTTGYCQGFHEKVEQRLRKGKPLQTEEGGGRKGVVGAGVIHANTLLALVPARGLQRLQSLAFGFGTLLTQKTGLPCLTTVCSRTTRHQRLLYLFEETKQKLLTKTHNRIGGTI